MTYEGKKEDILDQRGESTIEEVKVEVQRGNWVESKAVRELIVKLENEAEIRDKLENENYLNLIPALKHVS
jgi:hypothetical protein